MDKINKNKLDPINMYSLQQIKRILEREEVKVPKINDEDVGDEQESEEQYTARLIEVSLWLMLYCTNTGTTCDKTWNP